MQEAGQLQAYLQRPSFQMQAAPAPSRQGKRRVRHAGQSGEPRPQERAARERARQSEFPLCILEASEPQQCLRWPESGSLMRSIHAEDLSCHWALAAKVAKCSSIHTQPSGYSPIRRKNENQTSYNSAPLSFHYQTPIPERGRKSVSPQRQSQPVLDMTPNLLAFPRKCGGDVDGSKVPPCR